MVRQQLLKDLKKAIKDLGFPVSDIVLSIPPNPSFGDYSTNIALQLAKQKPGGVKQPALSSAKRGEPAMEIAKEVVDKLKSFDFAQDNFDEIKIAGPGFINFFIKPEVLSRQVEEILEKGSSFGQNQTGKGKKYQVEFVSANPTGPLTLANGRGGAIGDTLANVLEKSGYEVEREYYFNDSGNQVRTLGESVKAVVGKIPPAENHYRGEYVKDLAKVFRDDLDLDSQKLGRKLAVYLMENEIKPALGRFGIKYDEFYSEQSIYERGLIEKTLEVLSKRGVTYEKDGAIWLKTTKFGDDKDRVIITSEQERGRKEPTYVMPDIAYHLDVFSQGFDKKINVWGSDHHGYVSRLKAGVAAAGYPDRVDIILMQMVRLFKNGQEVRMSKRAGTFVALDELLEVVGKDAARFFFLMYSPDSQIDFDLDLAKERSNKNPVYYVQYAYARTANILAKVGKEEGGFDYRLLLKREELELIKHLAFFADLVEETASTYQVHKLTGYATTLADLFHKFYESQRVLNADDRQLCKARLALVKSTKIVLENTLSLLGVEAPERM